MATLDGLSTALRNADAAGDVDAARMLAAEITKIRSNPATDVVKSIPDAVSSGLTNFAGAPGSAINWLTNKANAALGLTDVAAPPGSGPSRYADASDYKKAVEQNVTGELYKPQTPVGKIAHGGIEALSNPASYFGPGGLLLKAGAAALSGTSSEAAGQATEGTAYEGSARLAAALAGGVAGAKAFGPSQAKAAVPAGQELKDIAGTGYGRAAASGLELDPAGVASWAASTRAAPDLGRFTGGPRGTAPKTIGVLEDLQAVPATPPGGRASIAAQNIDDIRKNLRDIAGEVQPTQGGAVKSTPDAVAAQKVLEHLKDYTENIPASHILAGDAKTYVRETKQANANYAAGSRASDFDARLTKAENATDRQVAGSLDSQIKSKAGQMIDRGARGLSAEEKAQLQLINSGGPVSNTLRQLGRGGAGVIPVMAQAATAVPLAMATGGTSVIPQAGLAAALYAARKGSEAITKNRANKLVEMLAKRSPEYESRIANLPQVSSAPNKAAIVRALLGQ